MNKEEMIEQISECLECDVPQKELLDIYNKYAECEGKPFIYTMTCDNLDKALNGLPASFILELAVGDWRHFKLDDAYFSYDNDECLDSFDYIEEFADMKAFSEWIYKDYDLVSTSCLELKELLQQIEKEDIK